MVHEGEAVDVVVGPFTHPAYAQGLERLLSEAPALKVVRLRELSEVRQHLSNVAGREHQSVVVLEGGRRSSSPSAAVAALIDSSAASFVLLDPDGTQTSISIDNPDGHRLVQIIRALAADSKASIDSTGSGRVRVLGPDESGGGWSSRSSAPAPALESVHRWLTLTLGLALIQLKGEQERRSIGGWYVSPVSALASLGFDPESDTAELVANDLAAIESDLFGDRPSLPQQFADIAETFALTDAELRVLILALAGELDGRYGVAIGVLQDDLTRRRPGLTLLARLMDDARSPWELRSALGGPNSMVANGLLMDLSVQGSASKIDEGIRPTAAVIYYLLNPDSRAAASAAGARLLIPTEGELSDDEQRLSERLATLATAGPDRPLINLIGSDTDWFERAAAGAGISVMSVDVSIGQGSSSLEVVQNSVTLCRLYSSALLLQGLELVEPKERRQICAEPGLTNGSVSLLVFTGEDVDWRAKAVTVLRLEAPTVTAAERSELWSKAARLGGLKLRDEDAQFLAATLPLQTGEMETCVALCRQAAFSDPEIGRYPLKRRIQKASRELNRAPLPQAVRRIETGFEWRDLVAADSVMESLRTISAHVAHSARVFEEWGFKQRMPYGHGLAALFSGPSGTGKTMAARIIAADLGVDLLQVDLSKTVSKYIGETEKNLDAAFSAAEQVGAVLLFDEADALFGKRTEVKDSHDRHANVEVAYLLQRIEAFPGLAILTSNLKQNIDSAFLRRLRFSVDFPVPNAVEREAIWHRSFPDAAPLDPNLDISFLARRLKLTGGSIQQIALHAAFAASAAGQSIGMDHVVAAARQELVKIGMLNTEKTLEGLAA